MGFASSLFGSIGRLCKEMVVAVLESVLRSQHPMLDAVVSVVLQEAKGLLSLRFESLY